LQLCDEGLGDEREEKVRLEVRESRREDPSSRRGERRMTDDDAVVPLLSRARREL
jgi:hypothetical protein